MYSLKDQQNKKSNDQKFPYNQKSFPTEQNIFAQKDKARYTSASPICFSKIKKKNTQEYQTKSFNVMQIDRSKQLFVQGSNSQIFSNRQPIDYMGIIKNSSQSIQNGPKPINKVYGQNSVIFSPSKSNNPNDKKTQKKKDKNKIKVCSLTNLKELKPINLEEQKIKFFEMNQQYNPIFQYTLSEVQLPNLKPHTKYLNLAVKILDTAIVHYKTDNNMDEMDGGEVLDQEQTTKYFEDYIQNLGVQHLITFEFQENTISPTTCVHNNADGMTKIIIGLPIVYRQNRIQGVLNHEIGTHFIRKYMDKQQKWYKHRKKYDLQNYSKIEEGLASCNQLFETAQDSKRKCFLYQAALHYYSAIMASEMSFENLYKHLEKYLSDPQKRWRECTRVKRGIQDTSQNLGMYKDQIYLTGAIKVLKYRKKLDFINLHSGKITAKDCLKLSELGAIKTDKMILPEFLKDMNKYQKSLDKIAATNFIDQLV